MKRILIVDDVISTGESLIAIEKLIEAACFEKGNYGSHKIGYDKADKNRLDSGEEVTYNGSYLFIIADHSKDKN